MQIEKTIRSTICSEAGVEKGDGCVLGGIRKELYEQAKTQRSNTFCRNRVYEVCSLFVNVVVRISAMVQDWTNEGKITKAKIRGVDKVYASCLQFISK